LLSLDYRSKEKSPSRSHHPEVGRAWRIRDYAMTNHDSPNLQVDTDFKQALNDPKRKKVEIGEKG
jgi:hypothetical protein